MKKTKVMALYLPQYHAIPENDEWWGKGFTEWTNVKKAKPRFMSHNQPRVPLGNNYYNLMSPDTFSWQVDLAKQYGIDAFCFYHYWFNGKLLLEKPLEMFLNRPELKIDYCFSWANEPWTKTWSGQNRDVLMPQQYEGINDIKAHFSYMLPFFKDERYIKIDNKPVFVLYRAESITYLNEMISIWNNLAIENGFSGIYFVETLNIYVGKKTNDRTQASFYMEPMHTLKERNILLKILHRILSPIGHNTLISYSYLWRKLLREEKLSELSWAGAFVDWDNSSRKKNKFVVVLGTSVKKFKIFFKLIYDKAVKSGCPFIVINAWNEWAEGTYLEPDEKNGYAYLEAIKEVSMSVM